MILIHHTCRKFIHDNFHVLCTIPKQLEILKSDTVESEDKVKKSKKKYLVENLTRVGVHDSTMLHLERS